MKQLSISLIGAALVSAVLAVAATPASALGGCGPNGHRNVYGYCAFGGQNQAYCLRRTGHVATRMPNGTLVCL